MPHSRYHDVGSLFTAVQGLKPTTTTAASTATDNVAQVGTAFDRHTYKNPLSCKLVTAYAGSLAAAKTALITVALTDSASSTGTYASFGNTTLTIGSTSSTAAQTPSGVIELDLDLGAAKRYLKGSVTVNLSATATDTVIVDESILLGGEVVLPAQ